MYSNIFTLTPWGHRLLINGNGVIVKGTSLTFAPLRTSNGHRLEQSVSRSIPPICSHA